MLAAAALLIGGAAVQLLWGSSSNNRKKLTQRHPPTVITRSNQPPHQQQQRRRRRRKPISSSRRTQQPRRRVYGGGGSAFVRVWLDPETVNEKNVEFIKGILADERGWTRAGLVFKYVAEPATADITVRILPKSAMSSKFPSLEGFSVTHIYAGSEGRRKRDVYINGERWAHGPDPAVSIVRGHESTTEEVEDPLRRYRTYIVNHEVGHGLFQDHPLVPSYDNQRCFVMTQQTKVLPGCVFNEWPADPEIEHVRELVLKNEFI